MRKLALFGVGFLLLGCGKKEEAAKPGGSVLVWAGEYSSGVLIPEADPGEVSVSLNGIGADTLRDYPGYTLFYWDREFYGNITFFLSTENLGEIGGEISVPDTVTLFPPDTGFITPGEDLTVSWQAVADFYEVSVNVEDSSYSYIFSVDTFTTDTQIVIPGQYIQDGGSVFVHVTPFNGPLPWEHKPNLTGDNPNLYGYLYGEASTAYAHYRTPGYKGQRAAPPPPERIFQRLREALGLPEG